MAVAGWHTLCIMQCNKHHASYKVTHGHVIPCRLHPVGQAPHVASRRQRGVITHSCCCSKRRPACAWSALAISIILPLYPLVYIYIEREVSDTHRVPSSECPMSKSCFHAPRALLTHAGALPACSDAAWVIILAYDPGSLVVCHVGLVFFCIYCWVGCFLYILCSRVYYFSMFLQKKQHVVPFGVLAVKGPYGCRRCNGAVKHVRVLDAGRVEVVSPFNTWWCAFTDAPHPGRKHSTI